MGQNYKIIKRERQKKLQPTKEKQTARTEEVGNGGRSNIHARARLNGRNTISISPGPADKVLTHLGSLVHGQTKKDQR